ncbi:MAG TPA: SDR family oxidoreductase [Solirubrobacterales bacterium]|jgi:NAD(P)-dependent dehydrogenase (short-subunit alcohol dehydrogenase family)|nr:SDR family oxidoreductase [Solirubrobacterales bacterium]
MKLGIENLAGKRCLITGAASGIGRATAIAVAGQGAELFLTDRDRDGLEQIVGEIRTAGGTVAHFGTADVANHEAVVALAAEAHSHAPNMDVVMNIAGISTWGRIEQLEHEHWRRTIDIDLMGPISVLECFVPPMIAAGRGGHIVNVASVAGLFGLPWHAPYSAAKFGLRGVSEVLRFDLRKHGIGVSLVCPGAVKTPLVGTVDIVGVDRESPRMRKLIALFEKRAVSAERVAERIVEAIERNRFMVFTSPDGRALYGIQRWIPPLYALVMRLMNRELDRAAR